MQDTLSTRPLWAELDLAALAANVDTIRAGAKPGAHLIASIKADAYGHGAVPIARALAALDVEMLATGSYAEAVAIRDAGIATDILMFGSCEPAGIRALLEHALIPTVYNAALADAASEAGQSPARVFIKIDCGFGRLGVALDDARSFVHRVASLPNIEIAGLYTHMPFSDGDGRVWATEGVTRFGVLLAELAADGISVPMTQALASAAVFSDIEDPGNSVCPGHALYGLAASADDAGGHSGLRPVLRSIRCRLIHVYRTTEARLIGSGGKRRVAAGTTIGIAPIGLTDGYRGPLPGREAFVLCNGTRCRVLGVSLEHTTIDLGATDAAPGDAVTIVGADGEARITLDDIAAWRGTSALEVIMSFSRRVPFHDRAT